MRVLVTGCNGFMGKHLCLRLKNEGIEYIGFDINNTDYELKTFIKECDFVVHLAGVMRPLSREEFYSCNSDLTKKLIDIILESNRQIPVLLASSTQAILDNDYGKTKKMCEDYLFNSGLPTYVFRFTNAFGKWGKPNYNSVASTFMYNIARNLEIYIRDPDFVVHFIYIDDIINSIMKCISGIIKPSKEILSVQPVYDCSLGHLADLLKYFKTSIDENHIEPLLKDDFEKKLFCAFYNYLMESKND